MSKIAVEFDDVFKDLSSHSVLRCQLLQAKAARAEKL